MPATRRIVAKVLRRGLEGLHREFENRYATKIYLRGLCSDAMMPKPDPTPGGGLKLPVTNVAHIDVERLAATLKLYEQDRMGFFEQIPRLR